LGALVLMCSSALLAGCSTPAPPSADPAPKPKDSQHAGITTPHGDHSAHHGGLVLMNGEVHYEVVLDRAGRHRIWFSDAVRADLPASLASRVTMVIVRKGVPDESLALRIDDSGESWIAAGRLVAPGEVTVTVSYLWRGEPLAIDIPFTVPAS
jgi:putative hemolysin